MRKEQFVCFCQNNEEDEGWPLDDALSSVPASLTFSLFFVL